MKTKHSVWTSIANGLGIPWAWVFVCVHFSKVALWLRGIDLSSGYPILNVDFVMYYTRVLKMHEFLTRSGRFWGYDPFERAGYVAGPFLEVGLYLIGPVCHFLSGLIPIAYSLLFIEIGFLFFAPFLVLPFVRLLGGSWRQAWWSFGIVVTMFASFDQYSLYLLHTGSYWFIVATFISLLQVVLFWRWLENKDWRRGMVVALYSSLLFLLHPAMLVIVGLPNLISVIVHYKNMGAKEKAGILLMAAVVVAANWYWIHPFLAFRHWMTIIPYQESRGWQSAWRLINPLQGSWIGFLTACQHVILLVLAVLSMRLMARKMPALILILGIWMSWLWLVGYLGSAVPVIRGLQPQRNILIFWLTVYIFAGMWCGTESFRGKAKQFAVALLAISLVSLWGMEMRFESKEERIYTTVLPDEKKKLLTYFIQKPAVDGRWLIETMVGSGPHFSSLVPLQAGHQILGETTPSDFLVTRHTLFSGAYLKKHALVTDTPQAFGHYLDKLSETGFNTYLALYNVEYIVAWSNSVKKRFLQFSNILTMEENIGGFNVYKVNCDSSWFALGEGDVSVDYDKIFVQNALPGRLVLKFHWLKTLKADPPLPLRPAYISDDPIPFIEIDNARGEKSFVIYNAGL